MKWKRHDTPFVCMILNLLGEDFSIVRSRWLPTGRSSRNDEFRAVWKVDVVADMKALAVHCTYGLENTTNRKAACNLAGI